MGVLVRFLTVVTTISLCASAHGYTIHSKPAIHEAITELAEACVDHASGARPQDCWKNDGPIIGASKPFSELEKAVRWPDDPTRQLNGASIGKLAVNLLGNCKKVLKANDAIYSAGLLCSSHYGRLQFMHAMASADADNDVQSRAKMLAWAHFTFLVASGKIALDQNICDLMQGDPILAGAFAPRAGKQCDDPSGYAQWTVRTFFTFTCGNWFSSVTCKVPTPGEKADALARMAARGALLHMIQDSYSASHAARTIGEFPSEAGPYTAQISCLFPRHFYQYDKQNPSVHGKADRPPVKATSCASINEADDAVTASAVTLWSLRPESGVSAEDYIAYLKARVFGPDMTS